MVFGGLTVAAAPGVASLFRGVPTVESDVTRSPSLWTLFAPKIAEYPKLTSSLKVDVAIIGGGFTGLSCAYYLKKLNPNLSVAVIDSHRFGSGASSRNSGAVSINSPGISDPGFNQRGYDRFRAFIEAEQIDCDFNPTRTLMMLNSDGEVDEARAKLKPGETLLGKAELNERISTDYYAGAIERPAYSTIQPAKLMFGLVRSAAKVGVQLYENTPALSIEHGKRVKIRTGDGVIECTRAVVATNAYSPRLNVARGSVFPIHHYTVATPKLASTDLENLGLDRWRLRFDSKAIACTFGLTPDQHFYMRLPLSYVTSNSEVWPDLKGAHALAERVCKRHYPSLANIPFSHGWHGVTAHTIQFKPVVETIGEGNVYVSVALNGLGIMPGHNFGYLTACKAAGVEEKDILVLESASSAIPFPREFYRSIILKAGVSMVNDYY